MRKKPVRGITVEQAQNMLLANGYRLIDAAASKGSGGDQVAVAYISSNAGGLFQKDQYYSDPFKYGNQNGSLTAEQKALLGHEAHPQVGVAGATASFFLPLSTLGSGTAGKIIVGGI